VYGPYRTAWQSPAPARTRDDLAIFVVITLVGALRAVPALVRGEDFGLGATVALFMMLLGALGWLSEIARPQG
jgi:hypothetical protein